MKNAYKPLFLLALLSLFLPNSIIAQSVKVKALILVESKIEKEKIEEAKVSLFNDDDELLLSVQTNVNGQANFDNISPGRYYFAVEKEGYKPLRLIGVPLESGANFSHTFKLERFLSKDLDEVMVSSAPNESQITKVGVLPITQDALLRMPGTYFDVSKLVATQPGVAVANDQSNGLIIHGMSPALFSWNLQGAEIVNPNHLTNAGTLSDQPTGTGGGVSMLSGVMLENSALRIGGRSTEIGNGVAGVMDMNLRAGKTERQYSFQLGLIGLDAMAEGAFAQKENASTYLVNYRYSTIGLLSAMGLDLGDEDVRFQDLSFRFSFPKKWGKLDIFGLAGRSQNYFPTNPIDFLEREKDFYTIDYQNQTGVLGFSYGKSVGSQGYIDALITTSTAINSRNQNLVGLTPFNAAITDMDDTVLKYNARLSYGHQFKGNTSLKTGFAYNRHLQDIDYTATYETGGTGYLIQSDFTEIALFANATSYVNEKLKLDYGVRLVNSPIINETWVQPSFHMSLRPSKKNVIDLKYGLNSMPAYGLLGVSYIKGHSLSLSLGQQWKKMNVQVEGFFDYLVDVPLLGNENNSISYLNRMEETGLIVWSTEGLGRNYGVVMSVRRAMRNQYFFEVNTTILKSEFQNGNNSWMEGRYDLGYIGNLQGGKEFNWPTKSEKKRVWGFSVHVGASGGLKEREILESESSASPFTEYSASGNYFSSLKDYFRTDLRLYIRRDHVKYSSQLVLDIQNVLNQQNEGFNYYDHFTQSIQTSYQLGLIPILSYRISF